MPNPEETSQPADGGPRAIPPDDGETRSVRVFVSSTFLDMQIERDLLVKEAFPELRARFRARGIELFEVDLRWGVTEEQSRNRETLPILLAEIDRCRPYFIGLIGDRYGWIPPADAIGGVRNAHPALRDADGMSVTAMEIMHGVLSDPETAGNALFFERDERWDWIATLKEEERASVESETAEERAKLAQLKTAIRAKVGNVQRYTTPSELRGAVSEGLSALLERRFPEVQAPDAFELDLRLHRAYARELRGVHVGAAARRAGLDEWMSQDDAAPLAIIGEPGCGKSALLANWLHARRSAHPHDIVFEHYIGASPASGEPLLLLLRLWDYLDRATGEATDRPRTNADLLEVAAALAQRLAKASMRAEQAGGRVLIALDGLDKLKSGHGLNWAPLAPRVKLLTSTQRSAQTAIIQRSWTGKWMAPLSEAERADFVERTLSAWGRTLLPSQRDAILAHPRSFNPLFLKTVLGELRLSATHASLNRKLEHYLGAEEIPDLFARALERVDADCEPGYAAKVLPLIWASRAGLEEAEIIEMSGAPPLAWAQCRYALGDCLRDSAGRAAFSHDYIRKAVEEHYLKDENDKRAAHSALAVRFAERAAEERQAEELPYQLEAAQEWGRLEALLLDFDRFVSLRNRGDAELSGYWRSLKAQGRDPETLLCTAFAAYAGPPTDWPHAKIHIATQLQAFLSAMGAQGEAAEELGRACVEACARAFGAESADSRLVMRNLATALFSRGKLVDAQDLQERVVEGDIRGRGAEHAETLASVALLARIVFDRGDRARARQLRERVLEARARLLGADHPDTLIAMNDLGLMLLSDGDHKAASELLYKAMAASRKRFGAEHPYSLQMMENAALASADQGFRAAPRMFMEQVLEAKQRLYGAEHPLTLVSACNLAQMLMAKGAYAEAHALYVRTHEAMSRALGSDHPDALACADNVGRALYALKDFAGARLWGERAVAARTRVLGEDHPATLVSMANLAVALGESGELESAMALRRRVLDAQTRVLGPDHPETLSAMGNFARGLHAQGEFARARELEAQVLEKRRGLFGEDHPRTIESLNNLASTLQSLGEEENARAHYRRALEAAERALGANHPLTRIVQNNLAALPAAGAPG